MTTAEALAVVREGLDALWVGGVLRSGGNKAHANALAALALIEEQLGELGKIGSDGLPTCDDPDCARDDHIIGYLRARAKKAEAERDELKQRATENWDSYENANRRIEELEAALRRIISDGEFAPFASPTHFGRIARRALGGGE